MTFKQRIITKADLVSMPKTDFFVLQLALAAKAFRLLGIDYKSFVRVYEDKISGNLILEWK